MSTGQAKRQHVIPRMLLRRFCGAGGLICMGDRMTRTTWWAKPQNAFVSKHQYSLYSYQDDSLSTEYESKLAVIESDAAPVFTKVISSVHDHKMPSLTYNERLALQRFVFSLARRTPESQARVAASGDLDDLFYQAVMRCAAEQHYAGLPSKEELLAIDGVRVLMNKVMHNVNAEFAAGDSSPIAEEEPKFCRETGLHFGTLNPAGPELVIGSHGITVHDAADYADKRLWFSGGIVPIAPHALINVTGFPDNDCVSILGAGTADVVHSVNRATASNSRFIGGRSEAVVSPLLEI